MKPDPRIDAYIARAAPFAQPILRRVRRLVGRACPEATEAIKWSSPFYVRGSVILCATPAFKQHCALIFWHRGMREVLARDGIQTAAIRRLTDSKDLPSNAALLRYIKQAVALATAGRPARPAGRRRPEAKVPADLAAPLRKNAKAAQAFRGFSPSHRREYIEWITEAKRPETRTRRLAETLKLIAAGKSRNWKYEQC
jgi:uncharacterized protein YdeI (YjbR/CyaY-like superfamily)